MSKHTPGPWLRDGDRVYTLHKLAHVEASRWNAQVRPSVGCPPDEADANARLIAAAPELLEALKWTARALDKEHPAAIKARAAIAKAEGEK